MAEKVIRKSLADQVQAFIITRIQNRQFQPGDRLNTEELAKEFGVSRTPVREAINRLPEVGFVEQIHNVGPCVARISKEQGVDIMEANAVLFPCIFRLMPDEAGCEDLVRELEDLIEIQEITVKNDTSAFHHASVRFHLAIIEHCTNQTLRDFALQTEYRMNVLTLYHQATEELRQKNMSDHKEILQMIRSRDWAKASQMMSAYNTFRLERFKEAE